MKTLGQEILEMAISESPVKTILVVYPGRFQPMGQHHAAVYKKLASKFGKSNTFVVTSDKVALPKSPLNFKEKYSVMKKHGITNVVQVKNPYQAQELTAKYDPETTALLFAVGKKDMMENPRFKIGIKKNGEPSYFQDYEKNKNNLLPFTQHGYLVVAPHVDIQIPGYGEMSGTTLRQVLAIADEKTFEDVMGFFDPKIYNLLKTKFSQIKNEMIESFIIKEASSIDGSKAMVDDGPRYYYGNQATYRKKTADMAERLGYQVLNYIVKDNPIEVHNTEYPSGPPLTVSFFPTGVKGADPAGTDYLKNYKGNPAYKIWQKYISKVATSTGYKFLDFLGADVSVDSSKKEVLNKPTTLREQALTKNWWSNQFKLITEAKANTHLTHLEELILTQGEKGYKQAKSFLIELLKNLAGNSNTKINTSVKWDGAPAIFTGINPDNGQFFVGTKSVFNKVPKINYTIEDIDMNHGAAPGLAEKLKLALQYFPSLGIKNILQGDFMFDSSMVKNTNIDGKAHLSFKPNTITYAVESDSDLGKEIAAAKIGIVFHTTYESLQSGASFGADVSSLNKTRDVWFDDAFFKDSTGIVTLTVEEAKEVQSLIKKADSIKINYENLPAADLNVYLNNEIRSGQFVNNPKVSFDAFQKWYQKSRIDKRVEKLKSDKGRMKAIAAGQEQMKMFQRRRQDIINLFQVSKLLSDAKLIFVKKYNNAIYNTKHFVDDGKGGLRVTAPEGYVAVDRIGNGVKFVDRVEFSRANFQMDKGFKK
tara:strand:+ start:183 stop:2468 length:2286 start_codon:yes stop_codon:yes gene_type:complete